MTTRTGTICLSMVTAPSPGAVGLLQLTGDTVAPLLQRLTGQGDWKPGRLKLADLAGIDEGLAVLLRDDWAQLMPHGGPQVLRKLVERLVDEGVSVQANAKPTDIYPEADSQIEADMLAAIATATSPAAVDHLLTQPKAWRSLIDKTINSSINSSNQGNLSREQAEAITARSRVLDRLLHPASVVVVGVPNVGKSTLTNRMLGRAASIVADLPGTTRDWVVGLAELSLPPSHKRSNQPGHAHSQPQLSAEFSAELHRSGVAVKWTDTPGLRDSDDMIEQRSIRLAEQVLTSADVLIAMRDRDSQWPDLSHGRPADIWVVNKVDDHTEASDSRTETNRASEPGREADNPLPISAKDGTGIDRLQQLVLSHLGLDLLLTTPTNLDVTPTPWAFSDRLRTALSSDTSGDHQGVDLRAYLSNEAR